MFIGEVMEHNEIFLELKMLMFDNRVNLNNVVYTNAFLEEIVEHKEKYICLPLVCDTDALLYHEEMTHLLNPHSNTFGTLQIGSFKDFEIIEEEDGRKCLIGYARVPKRNAEICNALMYLHEIGELKFSYEIIVHTCTVEQGVTTVDVSDDNHLIGLAVVTHPACPTATSLLVAEDQTKGGENMKEQTQDPAVLPEDEILEEVTEEIIEEPAIEEIVVDKPEIEEPVVEEKDPITQVAELAQIVMDLKAEITQKDALITELNQYKTQVETAEAEKQRQLKEAKVAELKEKAKAVLNETEMLEIAEAIENLDEQAVMAKIGCKFIAQAAEKEKQIHVANVTIPNPDYRILDSMVVHDGNMKYFTI